MISIRVRSLFKCVSNSYVKVLLLNPVQGCDGEKPEPPEETHVYHANSTEKGLTTNPGPHCCEATAQPHSDISHLRLIRFE